MWRLLRRLQASAALLLLPGDRTPVTRHDLAELRRDWATWEQTFEDLLRRLSMQFARSAKAEKRRLERQMEGAAHQVPAQQLATDPRQRKRELSRRLVGLAGGHSPAATGAAGPPPPDDDEEDDE